MSESQNIEWKQSWRDEYLKWICGFANAQGGRLYIGCDDNGKVIGVKDSKRLLEDIPNKVYTTMGIMANVNLLTDDGKDYLEIVVSPSAFPISYRGEFHYRSGATKQILRGVALTDFITSKTGFRWEDVTVEGVAVEDLDKDSFDIFRREAVHNGRMTAADVRMSNSELLERLNLLTPNGLSRAAVMLFHRTPEKWVSGCYTKIGKFGAGSNLQYQDEVKGSLLIQAERVIELIYLKYLVAPITYDNVTRVETYPFPKDAVREAVYYALIHCRWSGGIPVQIRIEDDAMYISNICSWPSDWDADILMKHHPSRPYNPKIAGTFFRAGYIESWGRGVQKICESCEAYGTPPPEYTVHSEDIMLKLSAHKELNVRDNVRDNVSDTEHKILEMLRVNPKAPASSIAESLSLSRKTVERSVKSLKEKGIIERVGSDRKGFWKINE